MDNVEYKAEMNTALGEFEEHDPELGALLSQGIRDVEAASWELAALDFGGADSVGMIAPTAIMNRGDGVLMHIRPQRYVTRQGAWHTRLHISNVLIPTHGDTAGFWLAATEGAVHIHEDDPGATAAALNIATVEELHEEYSEEARRARAEKAMRESAGSVLDDMLKGFD